MGFLRVDTVHLFRPLRDALLDLMRSTSAAGWQRPTVCPGWTVQDLGLHLLGVEMHNVSRRRDGQAAPFPELATNDKSRLALFNEGWVNAARGMSPKVLCDLLDTCSTQFESFVQTVDLDDPDSEVSWASSGAVPAWLDIAREYTERWVHQQQMREALEVPGLTGLEFQAPVTASFVHAFPMALRDRHASDGASVDIRITGDSGGHWHLVRHDDLWDLREGLAENDANSSLETDVGNFWRLVTRHPLAENPSIAGDPELGGAAANAVAIML